ncbi:hypothetical protein PFICI_10645 [Pestalotiopsis fici W106-1]|uniref:Yeast cell wall synthesis Kre9/Knh1-like N-terminal domain-containing protein n=1 Tax=Pestalotiopsis fici (strain W106-1 / CGMCC3.15140) TaxID=1229662 RepID=W3WXI6_PESFW|nr:uncharacterized protein PFICI_10645 [Pestalotiopsis fici W106-1]ETS78583.1 hypothetical protein PFICI_10645 [Pestalotiopsis fici W106-1]
MNMRFSTILTLLLAGICGTLAQTPGFDPMSKPTNWQDVTAGENFQIVWDPTSYKGTITLELLGGGSPATLWILGNIAQGVDNQQGQYNWAVPTNLGQLETYGIRILLESNPSILQYSFPFHVRQPKAGASTQSPAQSTPQAAPSAPAVNSVSQVASQPTSQTSPIASQASQTISQSAPKSTSQAASQAATSTILANTAKTTPPATTQPAPQPTVQTITRLPERCKVRRRWAPSDFGYSSY